MRLGDDWAPRRCEPQQALALEGLAQVHGGTQVLHVEGDVGRGVVGVVVGEEHLRGIQREMRAEHLLRLALEDVVEAPDLDRRACLGTGMALRQNCPEVVQTTSWSTGCDECAAGAGAAGAGDAVGAHNRSRKNQEDQCSGSRCGMASVAGAEQVWMDQ